MASEPKRPDGMPARDRIPGEDTYLTEEADPYMDHLEARIIELEAERNQFRAALQYIVDHEDGDYYTDVVCDVARAALQEATDGTVS